MASLFISHSSHDRATAELVGKRLQGEGFAALFLDFDPNDGIPAGRDWERELYAQLRKSDAMIFLASTSSVASHWCFAEVALARALGKPVVPLRLDPDAQLGLLDDVQAVDLDEGDVAFARLTAGLRRVGLDARDSFAWDPNRPPYPGLAAFSPEDAAVFFGRDDEIDEVLHHLDPILARIARRLLVVVGPSGSGKSSLLHAGVLPRLERMPDRWAVLPPLRPGARPMRSLAGSLAQALGYWQSPAELESRLALGSPALVAAAEDVREVRRSPNAKVLLVIDQAEELLTRAGEHEQHEFLHLLRGALAEDSPLWAVATVRSEFLGRSPERSGLTQGANAVVVEPLSRARLPEVIQRPAQRGGLDFDPGLVERMVDDTAGGDALPLLAYTLRELYERVGPEGRIRTADYESLGGVTGALHRRADRIHAELTGHGRNLPVVPTLLKLASVDREGEPTRRALRRTGLTSDEQLVVDAFIDARLLASHTDPDQEPAVEVTHEALLRQWPPLRDAIADSRRSLQLRTELERLATDWDQARQRHESPDSYLVTGGRLAAFTEWAERHPGELTSREHDFLRASQALDQRRIRRLRAIAATLAGLLVIALISGFTAVRNALEAREQATLALSRNLLAQATALGTTRPDVSLLLHVEALRRAPGSSKEEARLALRDALTLPQHVSTQLAGHSGAANAVAFGRDGTTVASAGNDRTIRLWDSGRGRPLGRPLTGHTELVKSVAFSPDGQTLASGGADATVRLWDVASGRPRGRALTGHTGSVNSVTFSPDGRSLASGSDDQSVRLWRVSTGRADGAPLMRHTGAVERVAFSPSGETLASASADETVRLWAVATGRPRGDPLTGHTGPVNGVAFSPDGETVASAGNDGTLRLWDVGTRKLRRPPLISRNDYLYDVAFGPDGKTVASANGDHTVRMWQVATGRLQGLPLAGHTARVQGVAFSPDGRTLASASEDQTVRLWQVAETYGIGRPLRGHRGSVLGVALSADVRTVASAGADGTIRLWDLGTGRPHGVPVPGHSGRVESVAFSPDGRILASAGEDATVRLWDPATGQARGAPLSGHTGAVRAVAFSSDGRTLASAGQDQTVRLWDPATGRARGAPLSGHTGAVRAVAFSSDGRTLASAGQDQTVRLWDPATGQARGAPLSGHTGVVRAVAFSRDGRRLASAGHDQTVRLWDVATGRLRGASLVGHTGWVTGVAFSADGATVASSSNDRTIRFWDVMTGQPRGQPLSGHTDRVSGLAFSSRGLALATASHDQTLRLWNLDPESWVTRACALANRDLSRSEWDSYVGSEHAYSGTCAEPRPS